MSGGKRAQGMSSDLEVPAFGSKKGGEVKMNFLCREGK